MIAALEDSEESGPLSALGEISLARSGTDSAGTLPDGKRMVRDD